VVVLATEATGAIVPRENGKGRILLIIGVAVASLILVVIGIILAFGTSSPPAPAGYSDLRITSSTHTSYSSLGKEVFTITVKNMGQATGTGTATCYVEIPGWDRYSNSHDVRLNPGQQISFQVDVSIPTAAFNINGTMSGVQIDNEQTVQ
jgi:hypothetical protein